MTQTIKHITKLILLASALVLFTLRTNAQGVKVVDNKGTLTTINKVTTSSTAPTDPVIGDVWYDDTIPAETIGKIYDGTSWKFLSRIGTPGSVFFAGSDGAPTENNSQFFWNNSDNRLYLGSPLTGTNKLNVNGAIRATAFNNAPGTFGLPSYRFFDDSNTGMYRISEDQLGFSTAGINALAIDATQNISIPKNLSVTGSYTDSSGDTGTNGQVLSSTNPGTNWIDNTKNTVTKSTNVAENTPASFTFPIGYTPAESDIFIYSLASGEHDTIYIYNDGAWVKVAPTKASRIFYPPSILVDVSLGIGNSGTIELYDEYADEFTNVAVSSPLAPAIPVYNQDELYYYVTKYDTTVFDNVQITATGTLTYDIVGVPTDDNAIFNVVFVVK